MPVYDELTHINELRKVLEEPLSKVTSLSLHRHRTVTRGGAVNEYITLKIPH
jgi:hypothetical protein